MKITFANDYTTPGGRRYKAGSTHEVNNVDARTLIHKGKAVAAKSPTSGEPTSAAAENTTPPAEG